MTAKHDKRNTTTVMLRLSDIDADKGWNARHSTGGEEGSEATDPKDWKAGYEDIKAGIARDGQKTPVVVRPHPKAGQTIKGRKMPAYSLCSGFQRFEILRENAGALPSEDFFAKHGMLPSDIAAMQTDKPVIAAFIRDLTEVEAREENLQENMLRCTLRAADIAWGIGEHLKLNPGITDKALAERLSYSEPYINVLRRTLQGMQGVMVPADHTANTVAFGKKDVPLIECWRAETVPLKKLDLLNKVATLKVGKGEAAQTATAAEKLEAYTALRGVKKVKGVTGAGKEWWENARDFDAVKVGTILGTLARNGVLTMNTSIWGDQVELCIAPFRSVPAPAKKDDKLEGKLEVIALAIMKAFNIAAEHRTPKPAKAAKGDATAQAAVSDGIPSPPEEKKASGKRAANGRAAL